MKTKLFLAILLIQSGYVTSVVVKNWQRESGKSLNYLDTKWKQAHPEHPEDPESLLQNLK